MMMTMRLRLAVVVLVPMALVACDALDADRQADSWQPKGLNAANLAAMVQDPADLARGHGDPGPDRKVGAHAVIEFWEHPTTSLPQDAASAGGATASGAGGGSGGAAAGGPSGPGTGN